MIERSKILGRARKETSAMYVQTHDVGAVAPHVETISGYTWKFRLFLNLLRTKTSTGKVPTQIGDDAGVVTRNETDINNDGFSMRSELVASIPASSKHHAA